MQHTIRIRQRSDAKEHPSRMLTIFSCVSAFAGTAAPAANPFGTPAAPAASAFGAPAPAAGGGLFGASAGAECARLCCCALSVFVLVICQDSRRHSSLQRLGLARRQRRPSVPQPRPPPRLRSAHPATPPRTLMIFCQSYCFCTLSFRRRARAQARAECTPHRIFAGEPRAALLAEGSGRGRGLLFLLR